jgi:hypothetical protein
MQQEFMMDEQEKKKREALAAYINKCAEDNVHGAQMITRERLRQAIEEKYSVEHDDEHTNGELAMAAACYASPKRIYAARGNAPSSTTYYDPWPWRRKYDKRLHYGEGALPFEGATPPNPETYLDIERIDLLVKAGALIAAEIDRLLRLQREAAAQAALDDCFHEPDDNAQPEKLEHTGYPKGHPLDFAKKYGRPAGKNTDFAHPQNQEAAGEFGLGLLANSFREEHDEAEKKNSDESSS